jgi:hypothetical protein
VMVCQIKFTEWTRDDRLRQPVFLRIRKDKYANERPSLGHNGSAMNGGHMANASETILARPIASGKATASVRLAPSGSDFYGANICSAKLTILLSEKPFNRIQYSGGRLLAG